VTPRSQAHETRIRTQATAKMQGHRMHHTLVSVRARNNHIHDEETSEDEPHSV
jgi:hypothetical protein